MKQRRIYLSIRRALSVRWAIFTFISVFWLVQRSIGTASLCTHSMVAACVDTNTQTASLRVLFTPDDPVQETLIALIDAESREILITSYRMTDRFIAQALMRAHQRGVHIEIVADRGCLGQPYSKLLGLARIGIPIYIYPSVANEDAGSSSHALMHSKIMIFSTAASSRACVWTGSYNFTQSAHRSNQENVIIITNDEIVERYRTYFRELCKRASLIHVD